MLNVPSRDHGVTIIEMMIAILVASIVLFIAVPSAQNWIANARVRAAAESIYAGLQLARSEAVRRNAAVELVLTDSDVAPASVNAVVPSASGSNWVVRVFQAGGVYAAADHIQGRAGSEGGAQTVTVNAPQSSFVFSGLGRLTPAPAADVTIAFDHANGNRPINIVISPAGQIRMCDPSAPAGDVRAC